MTASIQIKELGSKLEWPSIEKIQLAEASELELRAFAKLYSRVFKKLVRLKLNVPDAHGIFFSPDMA